MFLSNLCLSKKDCKKTILTGIFYQHNFISGYCFPKTAVFLAKASDKGTFSDETKANRYQFLNSQQRIAQSLYASSHLIGMICLAGEAKISKTPVCDRWKCKGRRPILNPFLPPSVTDASHMGNALTVALQDTMIE